MRFLFACSGASFSLFLPLLTILLPQLYFAPSCTATRWVMGLFFHFLACFCTLFATSRPTALVPHTFRPSEHLTPTLRSRPLDSRAQGLLTVPSTLGVAGNKTAGGRLF